jgi:protein transport protein SEC24
VYTGLRVDQLTGNFHLSDSFSLTSALSEHQYASIQCAVLHTTADGCRRVRVINSALQVADIAANVFRFADMDVVMAHSVRQCKFIFAMLDHRSDLADFY